MLFSKLAVCSNMCCLRQVKCISLVTQISFCLVLRHHWSGLAASVLQRPSCWQRQRSCAARLNSQGLQRMTANAASVHLFAPLHNIIGQGWQPVYCRGQHAAQLTSPEGSSVQRANAAHELWRFSHAVLVTRHGARRW
jgi:hypothetical protein